MSNQSQINPADIAPEPFVVSAEAAAIAAAYDRLVAAMDRPVVKLRTCCLRYRDWCRHLDEMAAKRRLQARICAEVLKPVGGTR
jgi:hypothetical protein